MKLRYAKLLTVATLVVGIIAGSPSSAISSGGIGGRPANPDPDNDRTQSIFIYEMSGGKTKTDKIMVSNASDSDTTIDLYPVDGVMTATGDMTCEQQVESRDDVGSWVSMAKSEVTLASKTSETVDFTVKVPKKADVGEHDGCIVIAQRTSPTEVSGGVQLSTRQAVRMAIIVPGEIHREVTIDDFKVTNKDGQSYAVGIKNAGNVSADVKVELTVKDLFGKTVYKNGGTYAVMPDSVRSFNYTSELNSWYSGLYTTDLKISYDKRAGTFGVDDTSQLITKTVKPVRFIAPAMILAIAIIAGIVILVILSFVVKSLRKKKALRAGKLKI